MALRPKFLVTVRSSEGMEGVCGWGAPPRGRVPGRPHTPAGASGRREGACWVKMEPGTSLETQ